MKNCSLRVIDGRRCVLSLPDHRGSMLNAFYTHITHLSRTPLHPRPQWLMLMYDGADTLVTRTLEESQNCVLSKDVEIDPVHCLSQLQ